MADIRLAPLDGTAAPRQGGGGGAPRLLSRRQLSFLLCVVLPTVLAAAYFGLLAASRYESEAKFVVRTPLSSSAGQLTSLMQGASVVRSADDAYIVHAYLRSRAALRELMAELPLRDMLRAPWSDPFWIHPLPFLAPTEQRLHAHLQRFVSVHFDQTTGISTLWVQAFRPQDAVSIATVLLRNAEKLINQLNLRVLQDAVEIARGEVESSQVLALAKQGDLTAFRTRWSLVDPMRMSTSAHETIGKLSLEAAQTRAQMAELRKASPQSAQLQSLQLRIQALDEQIRREQQSLAGDDGSLAPRIAEYERHMLFREFAERSFASAMTTLELARSEAVRQKLYLEQISTPLPADHHRYPYRVLSILLVAGLGLCAHLILQGARKRS